MRGRLKFQSATAADVRRFESAANSLFQNILRLTPSFPIFCEHARISPASNLLGINFLPVLISKTLRPATPSKRSREARNCQYFSSHLIAPGKARSSKSATNSLSWNILRVTPLNSIFCEHKAISPVHNLSKSNILRALIQKTRGHQSQPKRRRNSPISESIVPPTCS